MKDSKNLIIGILCVVLCVLAVTYSAFTRGLEINGTAEITSKWDVKFTAISCSTSGTAVNNGSSVSSQNGLTATVDFTLTAPGDSAYCDLTVSNNGTLPAKFMEITYGALTQEELAASPIMITVSQPTNADLAVGANHVWKVTAVYDENVTSIPDEAAASKSTTITLNYKQNLGV